MNRDVDGIVMERMSSTTRTKYKDKIVIGTIIH